jgi:hypothetical protein
MTCRLTARHKVALSDSDQRAVLVTVIELALYMSMNVDIVVPTTLGYGG